MKKTILSLVLVLGLSSMMTSCYTYSHTVGKGPQNGMKVNEKNHYLIYGLATLSTCDANKMADGAKDYEVVTRITFLDGLIGAITFGIYTPTTTTVVK